MIVSHALADAVAAKIVANGFSISPTTAVPSLPLGVTNSDRVKLVDVEVDIPVNCEPSPKYVPNEEVDDELPLTFPDAVILFCIITG